MIDSLTLQSMRATRFSWCSSVNSFKIFISFPSKFWDFAKFFFVIAFIATTLFGAWKENILFHKERNSIQSSKSCLRVVRKYFIHGNCILHLCVKMHLCSFLLQKFCLFATELDNLFHNPINAVFSILFYDPVINRILNIWWYMMCPIAILGNIFWVTHAKPPSRTCVDSSELSFLCPQERSAAVWPP